MAGGRPIETPFGIIYSANLTSDAETGIGSWTADQFYHAMHNGIGQTGTAIILPFPTSGSLRQRAKILTTFGPICGRFPRPKSTATEHIPMAAQRARGDAWVGLAFLQARDISR